MNENENPYVAPDTLETAAPGQTWLQTSSAGLARTVTGLNLVYYGIVVLLLSIISMVVMMVFPPLAMISLSGIFIGYVMLLVGPLFCLAVPAETGAKGLIVGAVCAQLIGGGATIADQVLPEQMPAWIPMVGSIAALLSGILFIMFLRKLASYIGRPDLSSKAINVLALGFAALVISVIVSYINSRPLPPRFSLLAVLVPILMLIAFVMYANLVNSLRLAIKSGAGMNSDIVAP